MIIRFNTSYEVLWSKLNASNKLIDSFNFIFNNSYTTSKEHEFLGNIINGVLGWVYLNIVAVF